MTYISRRPPRAWQVAALAVMRDKPSFAVQADMRTGKTKVIVDEFGALVDAGEITDLIVAAPAGAYRPWVAAIQVDLPINMLRSTKILLWEARRTGTKKYKSEIEEFLSHEGPRALIVNTESLSSVATARGLVLKVLRGRPRKSMVVVDESVVIKSPDSIVGAFMADPVAPLAARRRILTGLIAPRSPLDLWNQFRFLDPKILNVSTFVEFKKRYAKVNRICIEPNFKLDSMLRYRLCLGGYLTDSELRVRAAKVDPTLNVNALPRDVLRRFLENAAEGMKRNEKIDAITRLGGYVPTISTIENLDPNDPRIAELRDKTAPYSIRVRLEDIYDMPASDFSTRDVEMHPEQRRVYDGIKRDARARLESMDYVTPDRVVTQLLRLHQVLSGHVVDEEGKTHDVPEYRTRALLELLADYGGKAVIWCAYDRAIKKVVDALVKEYGEDSVSRFWGGNASTREEEERWFKTDPRRRFMVATPDAGGRGRDWSEADLCAYHSCRVNLDHRQQSERRLCAAGKMRPIAYVDLVAPGTLDERNLRCLRERIDLATAVIGDRWREWVI
jgi:hypothetical protein